MTGYNRTIQGLASDYGTLRAIPAGLGVIFGMATLYLFGAFAVVELAWFDYTIQTTHAMGASLGVMLVAFMSSETRSLPHYEDWEKALIAYAPSSTIAYEYFDPFAQIVNYSEPWTQIGAAGLCFIGYYVAIR